MKCPSIVDVREVAKSILENQAGIQIAGNTVWVPARASWSIDSIHTRIAAAWLVWTGRADALVWPGQ